MAKLYQIIKVKPNDPCTKKYVGIKCARTRKEHEDNIDKILSNIPNCYSGEYKVVYGMHNNALKHIDVLVNEQVMERYIMNEIELYKKEVRYL